MDLGELSGPSEEPVRLMDVRPRRRSRLRWARPIGRAMIVLVAVAGVAMAGVVVRAHVRSSRKAGCSRRLHQIGLAFHRYQEARDRFPAPAIVGEDGRPLLSWRVAILPYLDGGEALYREFRLDEPWDGPHNRALVARMPAVFACPSGPGRGDGLTSYRVVASKEERPAGNPLFQDGRGVEMLEVSDGASGTILVAEATDVVPWTRPDEIRDDADAPPPAFGSRHLGGFHVLLVDGLVRFLHSSISPVVLRTLITRDGGEVLTS